MNILHVESGRNWGGQEFRNFIEVQWLNAHGHKSWLICDPASESFRRAADRSIPIVPLRMGRRHYIASLERIWRFCRRERVDVIQTHSSRDSWLCFPLFWLGYPVVRSRNITHRVTRASRAFVFRFGCSRIIATADCIKKDLIDFSQVKPERIEVVGEGVDLKLFNPHTSGREFRMELDVPPNAPLIGMIAMLRSEKGALDFVEAAVDVVRAIPSARFVLVGDGPQRPLVECKIKEALRALETHSELMPAHAKSAPITLTGYRQDTPGILAALDVVVIPSRQEARCRVLAEAFAIGRPVIATSVGGIPETLRDGLNGILVPPKQPGLMSEAIIRLLIDHELRSRVAAAGLETARKHLGIDAMMEETLGVYRRLCG